MIFSDDDDRFSLTRVRSNFQVKRSTVKDLVTKNVKTVIAYNMDTFRLFRPNTEMNNNPFCIISS